VSTSGRPGSSRAGPGPLGPRRLSRREGLAIYPSLSTPSSPPSTFDDWLWSAPNLRRLAVLLARRLHLEPGRSF
jgi:hypothetical protein